MPDFDANEDLPRLPGAGQGGAPEPAERSDVGGAAAERPAQPPIVRRARQQRYGHAPYRLGDGATRSGIPPLCHRRRMTRVACPRGGRAPLVEAPSRRSRRLWALCDGQPPGSRS
jgi:hypothetical protein